jgi:antitoxin ParD1/3/4
MLNKAVDCFVADYWGLTKSYDMFIRLQLPRRHMTMLRKTVTVTGAQDIWIKDQIAAGHYTNDSECIRDLIRREQERSSAIESIRAALAEGESSGLARPFDLEAFKRKMNGKVSVKRNT